MRKVTLKTTDATLKQFTNWLDKKYDIVGSPTIINALYECYTTGEAFHYNQWAEQDAPYVSTNLFVKFDLNATGEVSIFTQTPEGAPRASRWTEAPHYYLPTAQAANFYEMMWLRTSLHESLLPPLPA